jgi:hypothetical protein
VYSLSGHPVDMCPGRLPVVKFLGKDI